MQSQIIESRTLHDLLPHITPQTLLLLDIDHTLIVSPQALGHISWWADEMRSQIRNGIGWQEAADIIYPQWIKILEHSSADPVEKETTLIIEMLQRQKVPIVGLTHRQPSVSQSTKKQLASIGFAFGSHGSHLVDLEICCDLKLPEQIARFEEGVLYVNDRNSKGDALVLFLDVHAEHIKNGGKAINKVVFVDDVFKNVRDVGQKLAAHGHRHGITEYVGVHYRAAENHEDRVYNYEWAKVQWEVLEKEHRLISNDEAQRILAERGVPHTSQHK
jgi:hypothetical protein